MSQVQSISIVTDLKPTLKITIFAVPKSFVGSVGVIQRNAIASWTKLEPQPEIILLGNDGGVGEIAREFNLKHIPDVRVNERGTPLLNDIFAKVHHHASYPILTYVNSDIILTGDFLPTVQQVVAQNPRFLMVGRRWNLDNFELINFDNPDWEKELRDRINKAGIFSGVGALDYFVFPKPLFSQLPEFAIGRPGWDNWMVGEALKNGYPVINASQTITIVHQNHDYGHLPGNRLEAFHGTEAQQNQTLLRGHFAGSSADATHYLIPAAVADNPKVSIIICTPNQAESLSRAIASVSNQNYDDLEIIVSDRNSTDSTPELIQSYHNSVRYIHQSNADIISARNRGLEIARGEFVLFLDAESVLSPNSLSRQVDCFEKRAGSLEMVFSGWKNGDLEVKPWHNLIPILQGREGLHGVHIWMLPNLWRLIQTGAILFRRSWVQRWGGFDSRLSPHAATLDLLLNLSSRGAAGICLEQPTLVCADNHVELEAIAQLSTDANQLIENYFSRPTLRDWMRPLESLARYQVSVWLACLAYHAGDGDRMRQLLKQSRNYSPYSPQETINNLRERFVRISKEYGYYFDIQIWQNLRITEDSITQSKVGHAKIY